MRNRNEYGHGHGHGHRHGKVRSASLSLSRMTTNGVIARLERFAAEGSLPGTSEVQRDNKGMLVFP